MISSMSIVGKLFFELAFDVFRAPLWWYTDGIRWVVRTLARAMQQTWQSSAIGVWIKNLFVPMYGQHDFWGRIISFFIRLFQIFFRLLWNIVYFVFMIAAFCVWLALPLAAWGLLIYSIVR